MLRLMLGTGPGLGCCLLMLLMVFGHLTVTCTDVVLHLETLQEVWDGHRLLTHVVCSVDIQLLVISLLLFPLLNWPLENAMGTLYFLHLSFMCTLCSATIYILVAFFSPLPAAPASGYLATYLSLLIANRQAVPWRKGRKILPLLCCGIILASQYLWPQFSLLYHMCAVICGLAYVSEPDLFTEMSLGALATQSPALGHFQDTPVWLGREENLEEAMLEAGILASLREYEQQETQELTLNKSSVSPLRLQQLERMGFPTGPAVVALAATGKVEGAVSLLVEGQVGGDIAVTTERQTGSGPQSPPDTWQ